MTRTGGEAWLLEVKPDRIRLRWDDPMLMQIGHGEWVRLDEAQIQRIRTHLLTGRGRTRVRP